MTHRSSVPNLNVVPLTQLAQKVFFLIIIFINNINNTIIITYQAEGRAIDDYSVDDDEDQLPSYRPVYTSNKVLLLKLI